MGDADRTELVTEPDIDVRCTFVRHRNVLAVSGEFGPIYTDHYLHLMQHQIRLSTEQDRMLKEGLAAFTLYLASRPWKEVTAWTASFVEPKLNVFLTGNSLEGTVVGRVFTEDIRDRERSVLYSQVKVVGQEPRQSIIEFEGTDFFRIAEAFHHQSDQRPGRYFETGPDAFVLLAAQPDCDTEWLAELDADGVRRLAETEETSLLETRRYRFECGCSFERLAPALAPLSNEALDELFEGARFIEVNCPRCGATFSVTREMIDSLREPS